MLTTISTLGNISTSTSNGKIEYLVEKNDDHDDVLAYCHTLTQSTCIATSSPFHDGAH